MKIETFQPRNEALESYIESYYILRHSREEKKVSYLTFPSVFSIVATVLNAENVVTPEQVTTRSSSAQAIATSIVCRFNKPICFQYEGDIVEVCIYFKPLGINAFLPRSLASYAQGHFDPFVPFPDYEQAMKAILETEERNLLAERLEEYWLGKMIGFEHVFLGDAIARIDEDPKVTTADLAREFGVSQKTLIMHFKKHLCKTPSEYKKIHRFRKALTEMTKSNRETKLTELSFIIDFFDQSHMVANFRALTGRSPKAFFRNLTTVENSNIHWTFT